MVGRDDRMVSLTEGVVRLARTIHHAVYVLKEEYRGKERETRKSAAY